MGEHGSASGFVRMSSKCGIESKWKRAETLDSELGAASFELTRIRGTVRHDIGARLGQGEAHLVQTARRHHKTVLQFKHKKMYI